MDRRLVVSITSARMIRRRRSFDPLDPPRVAPWYGVLRTGRSRPAAQGSVSGRSTRLLQPSEPRLGPVRRLDWHYRIRISLVLNDFQRKILPPFLSAESLPAPHAVHSVLGATLLDKRRRMNHAVD
jgi:hypothetical protein